MATAVPLPPPGFDELSTEEKLEYLQSLWDRIAARPEQVPVPDWHRHTVDERLEEHRSNPADVQSWEEVRDGIERRLRGGR